MLISLMLKTIIFFLTFNLLLSQNVCAKNLDFKSWLNDFKIQAVNSGISELVVNDIMSNAKYLPKVIEYDRYQPELKKLKMD